MALELRGVHNVSGDLFAVIEKELLQNFGNEIGGIERGEEDGVPALLVQLHPGAEDVIFLDRSDVQAFTLDVVAQTWTAGPGYHDFVCEVIRAITPALHATWQSANHDQHFFTNDFEALTRAFDLRDVAKQALELTRSAAKSVDFGMPVGTTYKPTHPLLTLMGPRDESWLRDVAGGKHNGHDIFPWQEKGLNSGYFLGHALTRMWTDMRWRTPLVVREAEAMKDILAKLERAHHLNPDGAYPWREWAEMQTYLGDESLLATRTQMKATTEKGALIGYRRNAVVVQLSGQWSITQPGEFADEWDDRGTYTAWDATRSIWFNSFTAEDENLTARETLDGLPELEGEVVEEDDGPLVRRASLAEALEEDHQFWQMKTYVAVRNHAAVCTICFDDLKDQEWAVNVLRSLRRGGTN